MELDKLQKIDLRKAWNNEAFNFTTWLAQEESLALLSDEIGVDIKLIQTEANVGKFNVDILAEEENTGRRIIIENQLEITNHDHLGKVITYAAGHNAQIIIWIVREVRDEHKQAIDWLNEHTDENVNFFTIKMELWQIGESSPAPKFQIISKPNDWAKAIKKSAAQANLSEVKLLQFDFWSKFREFVANKSSKLRLQNPSPQHWYNISIGNSSAHLSLTTNTVEGNVGCELYIPNDKDLFHGLTRFRGVIEDELGEKPVWMDLPGKKASRIKVSKKADIEKTERWEEYFEWLKSETEKFQKVFTKYLAKVNKKKLSS